jgi:hypothetical protein
MREREWSARRDNATTDWVWSTMCVFCLSCGSCAPAHERRQCLFDGHGPESVLHDGACVAQPRQCRPDLR